MVKKNGSEYVCQNCGAVYPKWQGKCDACGEWNTIVEEKVGGEGFSNFNPKRKGSLLDFVSLSGSPQVLERLHTNIRELDRVCGGGLVPGSVILVGGDPGIGKSTLLLQVCASIANLPERPECYYISGEEAADQVKIRARRLGAGNGAGQSGLGHRRQRHRHHAGKDQSSGRGNRFDPDHVSGRGGIDPRQRCAGAGLCL